MCRYQKGKTNLDFTEARESEWQWHQLGHMQVCISLQTDNHASTPTPPLKSFLQAGCPSCRPTNSVKALKAKMKARTYYIIFGRPPIGGSFPPSPLAAPLLCVTVSTSCCHLRITLSIQHHFPIAYSWSLWPIGQHRFTRMITSLKSMKPGYRNWDCGPWKNVEIERI